MDTVLPRLSLRQVSGGKRASAETGMVHLGLGNFHRAHQAMYTAAALAEEPGPWGIVAAANASPTVVSALTEQDLLYHVVELSPDQPRISVPAVHTGVLVAADDPGAVVESIATDSVRVVTVTVTEHGYWYSPDTGGLALNAPEIQHDLTIADQPRTAIGQIARALQRRARTHGRGVTVLSCDNLTHNGSHTRQLVREFAAALPGSEGAELLSWMDAEATFPSTMVDRIVPATTDSLRRVVAERAGVVDTVPVPAEPFSMWVLEDRFAQGRPRWEAGGAIFTDDVSSYELLKLRLLNGTHSMLAYLGMLGGCEHIPDAVELPFIAEAARKLIGEVRPTFTAPDGIDVDSYVEQLFARFSNAALGHRTSQVGSDGSVKLPQRTIPPLRWHYDEGHSADHLHLTIAAYLCCAAPLENARYQEPEFRDPARKQLRALASQARSARDFVADVVHRGQVFSPDLAELPGFLDKTAEFVDILTRFGPKSAVEAAS